MSHHQASARCISLRDKLARRAMKPRSHDARIQIDLLLRKLQADTDGRVPLEATFMETKYFAVFQFEFNAGAALLFI